MMDDVTDIVDGDDASGGADRLDDIGGGTRKDLVDRDGYEWFRRGLRGGAIGGLTVGGFLGLLPVIGILVLVTELSINDVLLLYFLEDMGLLIAVLLGVILTGLVGGGVTGAAVGWFVKGNSGWYGPLSVFVGAAGGFAMIVFVVLLCGKILDYAGLFK
jgi:hypothetical protein